MFAACSASCPAPWPHIVHYQCLFFIFFLFNKERFGWSWVLFQTLPCLHGAHGLGEPPAEQPMLQTVGMPHTQPRLRNILCDQSSAHGVEILALHADLGIALPQDWEQFLPISIFCQGFHYTFPAAKAYFLLAPHLQEVFLFLFFFSILHTARLLLSLLPEMTPPSYFL